RRVLLHPSAASAVHTLSLHDALPIYLYLADLAKLREEAARLKGIKLDTERLRLVRLDQLALQSLSPVKPKKPMIIALGLVLGGIDRKSTRLNSSHVKSSYAVFCLKNK